MVNNFYQNINLGRVVWVLSVIILFLVFILTALGGLQKGEIVIEISYFAAFLGGVLSLLAPCSAIILPAFFAYSFKEKKELVKMTLAFFLGLAFIFVPLGFSASLISIVFIKYRKLIFLIGGLILILLGILTFLDKNLSFWRPKIKVTPKKNFGTIFSLGIASAFGIGTCVGPILGGIVTLAATLGTVWKGTVLLLVYTLGIVAPLFLISFFFERLKWQNTWFWKRGLKFQFKSWSLKLTLPQFLSSLLLFGVGIIFIFSKGGNFFQKPFSRWGITSWNFDLSVRLLSLKSGWLNLITILLIFILSFIIFRSFKRKSQ